jgi:hypothetical protein
MSMVTYNSLSCWSVAERSPSFIYNQIKVGGCEDGSVATTALNLLLSQGDCGLEYMSYYDGDCSTMPNSVDISDASHHKLKAWYAIHPVTDVAAIKSYISMGYPVVIGFQVLPSFDAMWASGGVWSSNSGTSRGGHETCIVGYDDTRAQFLVQNQWGAGGYMGSGQFWVTYDLVAGGCLQEAYVVVGYLPPAPLAGAATALSATAGCGGYFLDFTPISGITGYTVDWKDVTAGTEYTNEVGYSATDYSGAPNFFNYVPTGHSFQYRLGVTNECGVTGNWSAWSSVISPSVPATGLTAVSGCGGYFLNFTPVPGVSGYTVDWEDITAGTDNTNEIGYSATDACGTPNFFNYVPLGHSFKYRLGISTPCGASDWSAWSATIVPDPCSTAPTGLTVANPCSPEPGAACGYSNFSWSAVAGAIQYQVTYTVYNPSTGVTEPPVTFTTTATSSYQETGYYSGAGWDIKAQVQVMCASGTWGPYSPVAVWAY